MCGIIACCSQEAAARVVVEGLKRMEYRGYDSAGIALIADGQLVVKKDIGNIHDIEARHKLSSLAGNIAIGRTRWPLMVVLLRLMFTPIVIVAAVSLLSIMALLRIIRN